jgi:hypothetical protein
MSALVPTLLSGLALGLSAIASGAIASLWMTKDGGRAFRRYKVPGLTGYPPARAS